MFKYMVFHGHGMSVYACKCVGRCNWCIFNYMCICLYILYKEEREKYLLMLRSVFLAL